MSRIEDRIDITKFISRFVKISRTMGDEVSCNCPFHEDAHASFSVNTKTGLWKCHAPQCDGSVGGNLVQFIALRKGYTNLREAYKFICAECGIEYQMREAPELSIECVDEYHFALLADMKTLKLLKEEYLWNSDTITKYRLGLKDNRITFPIYDATGRLVNIRKKPLDSGKCIGIEYHNQMRIYPIINMGKDTLYFMEGEKDCLLANQLGLNAITVTSGAGSFKQEWITAFKGKRVVVCFDIDKAGIAGAQRIKEFLINIATEFKIVALPIKAPVNADFTDYIKAVSLDKFKELVADTKAEPQVLDRPVRISEKVTTVDLASASLAEYYFHRVQLDVVVSGKDTQPYLPPRQIHLTCPLGQKSCVRCGLAPLGGDYVIKLDHLSADILQWIDCSEDHHQILIRRQLDIPQTCRIWKHHILEAQNVEEVTLIPEIDYASADTEYVIRTAYALGLNIKSNHSYRFEAVTVPHPKDQHVTHLLYAVTENKTAIDEFKMDDKIMEKLKIFRV